MNYQQAERTLATARSATSGKPLQNNTRLFKRGEDFAVQLHDTDVVTIHPDDTYTLNSGGWQTLTTKARINDYAPAWLYQEKGLWYVSHGGERFAFVDGMKIDSTGKPLGFQVDPARVEAKTKRLDKLVKDYIDAFVTQVEKDGEPPEPHGGDCWFCYMRTSDGKPWGENEMDHILSHLKSRYIMGSLLFNAIRSHGYTDPAFTWHYFMSNPDRVREELTCYFRKLKPRLMKLMF